MKTRHLRTTLQASICILILLPPLAPSPAQTPNPKLQTPILKILNSKSPDWWTAAQENIRRQEYDITWQQAPLVPGGPPGYQVPNRAHNLRVGFDSTGVRVVPRITIHPSLRQAQGRLLRQASLGGVYPEQSRGARDRQGRLLRQTQDRLLRQTQDRPWTLDLALTGFGRGGKAAPVNPPTLSAHENHVTYQRSQLTERYTNNESGLEQELQISKPEVQGPNFRSPILLEFTLSGDLAPHPTNSPSTSFPRRSLSRAKSRGSGQAEQAPSTSFPRWRLSRAKSRGSGPAGQAPSTSSTQLGHSGQDDQAIEFATADGTPTLRYAALRATDAAGHHLPVHLELAPPQHTSHTTHHTLRLIIDDSAAIHPITIRTRITTLPSSANWIDESDQDYALLGFAVSAAGDVNGDGYGDVIVGAPKYDRGQTEEGVVFLYTGGPDGLDISPAWIGEGDQEWAGFGHVVAAAGDVNGDGYGDVIVGAPRYDGEHLDDGKAFVYHGGPGGLAAHPAWVAPPDGQGIAVFGISARFGVAVSAAGDVNGDGYGDVIVTANGYDAQETNEGAAFVYHGGPTGLDADPAWAVDPLDQAYANFGRSASTAGDVNGDGYSDVIVGAPWYDNPQSPADDEVYDGTAFVYHGSPTGLNPDPAWTFADLFTNSEFGIAVSTAGDVNGDGYSDVIIGAYKYTEILWVTPWREGAVFVYHGSAAGLTSSLADWMAVGGQEHARFGISVSAAGDVNGDGYSDVIVGASNYTGDQTRAGAAYVYHGSATGLTTSAADWSSGDNQERSGYGFSVSTAGDVNGDGCGDVIVGAPTYNDRWTDEGAAFIYLGNDGSGLPVRPVQLRTDSPRRMRTLYRPGNPLGQTTAGRWFYLPWNGPQEADFRTPNVLATDQGASALLVHPVMRSRFEQFYW